MTAIRSSFWLGLGAMLLVLPVGGCATVSLDVNSDHDESFDFAAVRTWDWMPGAQPDIPDPRVMDSVVDARMRDTIAAHGIRGVDVSKYRMDLQEPVYDPSGRPRADFFTEGSSSG